RGDSGATDAQIDADDLIGRLDFWRGNRDNDVQPPMSISLDQVSSISRIECILGAVIGNAKADRLSSAYERHPHRAALPIYLVGMQVIARWAGSTLRLAHLAASAPKRERALDGFGRLDARLDVQIAHQGGVVGFERIVQRAVQLDTVLLALMPSVSAHSVEHCRKLATRFSKCGSLGLSRLKLYAYRALHTLAPLLLLNVVLDGVSRNVSSAANIVGTAPQRGQAAFHCGKLFTEHAGAIALELVGEVLWRISRSSRNKQMNVIRQHFQALDLHAQLVRLVAQQFFQTCGNCARQ